MGVTAALSALAINAADVEAVNQRFKVTAPENSSETNNPNNMINIGTFTLFHLRKDKYSTANLPPLLRRIGGCESNGSARAPIDYKAQNPSSTASGGFQFLDSTWKQFWGYKKARQAPPRVQNRKAVITYKAEGTTPWLASRPCWD